MYNPGCSRRQPNYIYKKYGSKFPKLQVRDILELKNK